MKKHVRKNLNQLYRKYLRHGAVLTSKASETPESDSCQTTYIFFFLLKALKYGIILRQEETKSRPMYLAGEKPVFVTQIIFRMFFLMKLLEYKYKEWPKVLGNNFQ